MRASAVSPSPVSFRAAVVLALALVLVNVALVLGTQANLPLRISLNDIFLSLVLCLSASALVYAAWRTRALGR